ncbi:MAG: NYN domain-containing protein [Candidatus Dojkabacteria bacterium]|nr:NYN domain-containing protein [Candidatus Dojkabacteria bacterium]
MIVKNKDQRVAVLVDVQNMYYSAKHMYSAKVNFKNVLKEAVSGRVLTRAIAYVIKTDIVKKEKDFFEALNKSGFEVKEKDLQIFPGGAKKGDWDVGITMDAIRLGRKVDSIVIVSGDGDYIPLVTYLQQSLGCLVEIIAFGKTCSKDLTEVADDFVDMDKGKATFLLRK